MITRVDNVNEKTLEVFTGLVKDLKMEFEAKALNVEALHVFNEISPEKVEQGKLEELYDKLSLDLTGYFNEMQEEASKDDTPSPKCSEILQAGVDRMKQLRDTSQQKLSSKEDEENINADSKAEIRNLIDFLTKSIDTAETALANSLCVEEKMQSTLKRRKLENLALCEMTQLDEPKMTQKPCNEKPEMNVLKHDGGQLISEVIQIMSHNVDLYVKIGKVPRQLRYGTSQSKSTSFSFLKVEICQPGAATRMHLIVWGALVKRFHKEILGYEDCVVRVRNAKYEYVKKYEEYQIKLNDKSAMEKVSDKAMLAIFETHSVPEMQISHIGECRNFMHINIKGYVKTYDDSPNGPSSNASYWRNFELSDASGWVVKGMAWGQWAKCTWTSDVTVEMFSVSVRKSEERIQLDESSVIIFHDQYDLSESKPTFFKPVVWPA